MADEIEILTIVYADKQADDELPIVEPGVTDRWRSTDANHIKEVANNHAEHLQGLMLNANVIINDFGQLFLDVLSGSLIPPDYIDFAPSDYVGAYIDAQNP